MHKEQQEDLSGHHRSSHERPRYRLSGVILIVLGIFLLLDNFVPAFRFDQWWPVLLIVLGITILIKNNREER